MNAVKRGICISTEMATWIYATARTAKVRENRVIVRMLQVAREDLSGLDSATISRLLRFPWYESRRLQAVQAQVSKRRGGRLLAWSATRLTPKTMAALREFARKNKVTMSEIHRAAIEAQIGAET